ncbi:hypothetical protein AVEN_139376-1 [Araneus ventricosus]|uniref:HTH CENPB-type domain-containing protein n=1 Tax=Araneus ventricosus TaxID=182803 RepID=A0A4Y2EDS8_ARAVE|nr:hypothetical protein AVEN_139376-1 [Araneus ventricosus]
MDWLESFRKRHGISFKAICGEAGDLSDETVNTWIKNIEKLIEGYEPQNIANADENKIHEMFAFITSNTVGRPRRVIIHQGNAHQVDVGVASIMLALCADTEILITEENLRVLSDRKISEPKLFGLSFPLKCIVAPGHLTAIP